MKVNKTREEEIKNLVRDKYFPEYDATPILGDIDFAVTYRQDNPELFDREFFLWAEAKAGKKEDIYASFIQLIITIGKARTHEKYLPPFFLGAFDEAKIAFIEYHNIVNIFYLNDFNWNITPSNHETKEFKMLYELLKVKLIEKISIFDFCKDDKSLRKFIHDNFRIGRKNSTGINITRNNFQFVFQRWVEEVKPSIEVNWNDVPKTSVVDFFYADLISTEDYTLREQLKVVLRGNHYKILQDILNGRTRLFSEASFNDNMTAYRQFWNKYKRPPRKEYIDLILERRDLLIPQDLRRFQGSYFTPPIWVQKSQEYLAEELGEDWQQEYYIWDCCAGTGNLLFGLTDPYRIWASTLDDADVQVMKDRIKENSLNLLDRHVFQFDFLNDPFDNLPEQLRSIIEDPEKRRKLVIYINPPYAEASDTSTLNGGKGKNAVEQTATNKKYAELLKQGNAELFVQFLTRIYREIPECVLAEFSKLKILQGPHFSDFRKFFRAKLGRFFCVPAKTFDNVKGDFPIGFLIWHTAINDKCFTEKTADVYNAKGELIGHKTFEAYENHQFINEWIKPFRANKNNPSVIGKFPFKGNDFQNQRIVQIVHNNMVYNKEAGQFYIDQTNIHYAAIYITVRKIIQKTWLNDLDQFLYPNNGWENDIEFRNDCLAYILFNNNIQSKYGTNHWIPFCEEEVGAQDAFKSHFMYDFINGNLDKKEKPTAKTDLFGNIKPQNEHKGSITFSPEAQNVMNAARELWKYYHARPNANPNASYYDIRLYFQGTKVIKGKERMNATSNDKQYTSLLSALKQAIKILANKIEPKVYEYGFLKQ